MNILLDTHIFLWSMTDDDKLNKALSISISDINNKISISTASLWEVAIKLSIGKLKLDVSFDRLVEVSKEMDIEVLQISNSHLRQLLNLPFHHKDPFDRLIISQAISENYMLASHDKVFEKYDVQILS